MPLAYGARSLGAFLLGVLLLDLAIQGIHISNQTALYRIRPEARNRLTAAYMTSYFLGGALGSVSSAWAFSHHGWPGAVAVDMTTTSPSLSAEIFKTAQKKGVHTLDAPVSGGDIGAKNGALSIMVGGEKKIFDEVKPLFERLGRIIVHQGPAGAGQHAKMCNQIVIAGSMIGVCESLLYAVRAGLNPETMLSSIAKGAAGCWSLENLAPRILKGDFAPGFMIDHFIKDMGIALEEAQRMGLTLPGLTLVRGLYAEAARAGHGRDGTQALFLALQKLSA